jgi:MFS family permease
MLSRIRLGALARTARATNFVRDLADGWRAFTEHAWVWVLTLWISLFFLVTYAPFFVLGPYVAKSSMGGAPAWATVLTGEAVGALLGGIVALRFQPNRAFLTIGPLLAVNALQCGLLAVRAPFAAIAFAAALAGFAFSYGTVVYESALQLRIAPDKLSRVSAYDWMGSMACLPLGYALAGPVAGLIGISTTLWIGAAWIVATTAIVVALPEIRDFRLRDPVAAVPALSP